MPDLIDVSRGVVSVNMPEITGHACSVQTRVSVQVSDGAVEVTVDSKDADPLGLIGTEPLTEKPDAYLYEEDTVHLAVALPGAEGPSDFVLVNCRNSASGSVGGRAWDRRVSRDAQGWLLTVRVPVPPGTQGIGLLVLRFYRGVHHEVHGLSRSLPHPMTVEEFTPVLLMSGADPVAQARSLTEGWRVASSEKRMRSVDATRQRVAINLQKSDRHRLTRQTASALARDLAREPVSRLTRALAWSEQHFLNGLLDLWEADENDEWIDLVLDRAEQVWSFRAHLEGRPDTLFKQIMPTWYDPPDGRDTYPICLLTGVILYPLARVYRMVYDRPALSRFKPRVEAWGPQLRQAISVHDREWIDLPGGQGNYLEPYEKGPGRLYPVGGSRVCPLNRSIYLALPLWYLAPVFKEPQYHLRVGMICRYFRDACQVDPDGALVWEYLTSRYPATGEDISHASSQVTFALRCHESGIGFTESDLRAMALTLRLRVLRYPDAPCYFLRGVEPGFHWGLGRWSALAKWCPEVLPPITRMIEAALADPGERQVRSGWMLRNIASVLLTRKSLGLAIDN